MHIGLRDGRMRRHEGTLARAVDDAEQSQFKPALQPNIDKAKELLKVNSIEVFLSFLPQLWKQNCVTNSYLYVLKLIFHTCICKRSANGNALF